MHLFHAFAIRTLNLCTMIIIVHIAANKMYCYAPVTSDVAPGMLKLAVLCSHFESWPKMRCTN